jgi:STE24 endopeptidase
MNATTILSAIIAIVIADYLLERGLSFLNCRSIATQLPDEVKGIYSEEKYQQSQKYKRANCRFELVTVSLQVVILLALLMGGGFAFIDGLVRGTVQAELLVSLLFFALLLWYVSRERFKLWSTRRRILLTSVLRV